MRGDERPPMPSYPPPYEYEGGRGHQTHPDLYGPYRGFDSRGPPGPDRRHRPSHERRSGVPGVLMIIAGLLGIIANIPSILAPGDVARGLQELGFEADETFVVVTAAIFLVIAIFPLIGGFLQLLGRAHTFVKICAGIGIISFGPLLVSSILCIIALVLITKGSHRQDAYPRQPPYGYGGSYYGDPYDPYPYGYPPGQEIYESPWGPPQTPQQPHHGPSSRQAPPHRDPYPPRHEPRHEPKPEHTQPIRRPVKRHHPKKKVIKKPPSESTESTRYGETASGVVPPMPPEPDQAPEPSGEESKVDARPGEKKKVPKGFPTEYDEEFMD